MVIRSAFAALAFLGVVLLYHDLPEYQTTITLIVGAPMAMLVMIVRRKHIFPIVCCSIVSLVGALLNTPVYCTGNGTQIDSASMISGVIFGGVFGMILNAIQRQRKVVNRQHNASSVSEHENVRWTN